VSTPPAPYVGGSRLLPVVLDAGDGAEVFIGFYDAELQVTCNFFQLDDGTYQCIPDPSTPGIPTYADAACTEKALSTCGDFDGYSEVIFGSCGLTLSTSYRLGDTLDGPAYAVVGTACVEQIELFPDLREMSPVATSGFVKGTRENVALSGSLGVRRIVGDDGSSVTFGLTRDGYDCTPTLLAGEVRCVDTWPATRFDVGVYADASCSGQAVGLFGSRDCALPPYEKPGLLAEYSLTDSCAPPKLFELGDEIEHAYAASDACRELESEQRFALVGAEIAPGDLPFVSRVERGTGRLRALSWGAGETPLLAQRRFRDTTLDADCTPTVTATGGWRCVPEAYQSDIFADPECTERLFPSSFLTGSCGGEPARFATILPSVCDPGTLYERGAPYTGDVYTYADSPVPGCQGPLAVDGTVYRLGAEVPIDGLGGLTRRQ
jgi:hypothetical protein